MKTDVGFTKIGIKALVVKTDGFDNLPIEDMEFCFKKTLENINQKTNFIVFNPNEMTTHLEDEGRTLIVSSPNISKKVYAKLDDYKGCENQAFGNRWVITFMLAEEY